jgi:hypothetical protein
MKLVPIPTGDAAACEPVWRPFLESIAKRARTPAADLVAEVLSGETQVHLIWDADAREAVALAGTRIVLRGADRVGTVCWLTGKNLAAWAHLLPDLEAYLTEHLGCVTVKPVCRPGYAPFLKAAGYRLTHQVWEKDF